MRLRFERRGKEQTIAHDTDDYRKKTTNAEEGGLSRRKEEEGKKRKRNTERNTAQQTTNSETETNQRLTHTHRESIKTKKRRKSEEDYASSSCVRLNEQRSAPSVPFRPSALHVALGSASMRFRMLDAFANPLLESIRKAVQYCLSLRSFRSPAGRSKRKQRGPSERTCRCEGCALLLSLFLPPCLARVVVLSRIFSPFSPLSSLFSCAARAILHWPKEKKISASMKSCKKYNKTHLNSQLNSFVLLWSCRWSNPRCNPIYGFVLVFHSDRVIEREEGIKVQLDGRR